MQRFQSPCIGCPDRQKDYACVEYCNKPSLYSAGLGHVKIGSIPEYMMSAGKSLTLPAIGCPNNSKVTCRTNQLKVIQEKMRKNKVKCLWPGCDEHQIGNHCLRHDRVIRSRKYKGWPDWALYYPCEPMKRTIINLKTLCEIESKIRVEVWYIEAAKNSAKGIFKKMAKR